MANHESEDEKYNFNALSKSKRDRMRHHSGIGSGASVEPSPFSRQELAVRVVVEPVEGWSAPRRLEMRQTTRGNVRYHRARMLDLRVEEHLSLKVARTRSQQGRVTRSQLFRMVWDDSIVGRILAETNARIAADNDVRLQRHRSGEFPWTKTTELVTESEFFRFCGVVLLMGQLYLRQDQYYWKGSPGRVTTQAPLLQAIITAMTHDRFVEIKHWLCFSDYAGSEEIRALQRLDWMSDAVFANCRKLYSPSGHLALDDQSITFFGRSMAVHGPRKRKGAKYALPLYSLNDEDGFTLAMQLMTKLPDDPDEPVSGAGAGAGPSPAAQGTSVGRRNRIILKLIDRALPNPAGFHITMDNEFTDYRLVDELSKRRVMVTGTIKSSMLTASSEELKLAKTDRGALKTGILIHAYFCYFFLMIFCFGLCNIFFVLNFLIF